MFNIFWPQPVSVKRVRGMSFDSMLILQIPYLHHVESERF
jgi:hypothetical protein